jgi:hypothetical protein
VDAFRFSFADIKRMGGERGSTTRMRLSGKICCLCRANIDPPYPNKERACSQCAAGRATRKVYMRFEKCHGWRVSFRDPNDESRSFRDFTFADASKIEELVARTGTRMLLEDRQSLETGLRSGGGVTTLVLTQEQFRKLLR